MKYANRQLLTLAALALAVASLSSCSDSATPMLGDDLPMLDDNGGQSNDQPTAVTCMGSQTACGIECIDLNNDPNHCGGCDAACGPNQVCDGAGQCEDACAGDRIVCGGRCVDPDIDGEFCGASGDCSGQLAGTLCAGDDVCVGGVCQVDCAAGYAKCGGECINPSINRNHCGATGSCGDAEDGSRCADGDVCSGGSCMAQCQGEQVECGQGCVDPNNSVLHCGATKGCGLAGGSAGTACEAGEVCNAGSCEAECSVGLVKCDGTCIDPLTERRFCGATASCASAGEMCTQDQLCEDGSCGALCDPGLIGCGQRCIDPNTDDEFCGASDDCYGDSDGTRCAQNERCNGAGVCQQVCAAGLLLCDGNCIDPTTDGDFCGASSDCMGQNVGQQCAMDETCNGSGQCRAVCAPPSVACNRQCIDPETDRAFCGASAPCDGNTDGTACAPGSACITGLCRIECPGGEIDCDGQCIDPSVDPVHCGAQGACDGGDSGSPCGQGLLCDGSGRCQNSCVAGYQRCGDVCVPTGQCAPCGNGDAMCDPGNLGGATCEGLGYGTGTLACDPDTCIYDTSMCMMGGGGMGGGGNGG